MPEPIEQTVSPWMPITDPLDLAILGKLGEECNELAGRLFRTIIQGTNEPDPKSGLYNLAEIKMEIADVKASIQIFEEHFKAHRGVKMLQREQSKYHGLKRWHQMIRDMIHAGPT